MTMKIEESEWDGIVRGKDAKRFMEIMKSAEPLPESERKRIREKYEAMAAIAKPKP